VSSKGERIREWVVDRNVVSSSNERWEEREGDVLCPDRTNMKGKNLVHEKPPASSWWRPATKMRSI